jgi:hypothetical protein
MKIRTMQYWRSRLFPAELCYYRVITNYGAIISPEPCTPEELAALIYRLNDAHGTPKRRVRQGRFGEIRELVYLVRGRFITRVVGRNYAEVT